MNLCDLNIQNILAAVLILEAAFKKAPLSDEKNAILAWAEGEKSEKKMCLSD